MPSKASLDGLVIRERKKSGRKKYRSKGTGRKKRRDERIGRVVFSLAEDQYMYREKKVAPSVLKSKRDEVK